MNKYTLIAGVLLVSVTGAAFAGGTGNGGACQKDSDCRQDLGLGCANIPDGGVSLGRFCGCLNSYGYADHNMYCSSVGCPTGYLRNNRECGASVKECCICDAGYYGDPSTGGTCIKCPSDGTSNKGATKITECYARSFSDTTGSGEYTSNCYYK